MYQDISYCKAEGNYTLICLADAAKKEMVSRTLKEFEEQLTDHNFMRVHRSYLVNLDQIKEYSRHNESLEIDADGGCVTMLNGAQVPVSRDRRKLLLKKPPLVSTLLESFSLILVYIIFFFPI